MKYVCSWSGGKDSTATILACRLYHEPLDTIIISEVMFDLENEISGENPLHRDFIYNVAIPTFKSWGYEVVVVRADKDYLSMFHRVIDNPRKHKDHAGKKYGFCLAGFCSVKRDLKIQPVTRYLNSLKEPYVQYLGICADEPKRLEAMKRNQAGVSILEKYGITQPLARDMCIQNGLYSTGYELAKRGGCIFCPYAKFTEHQWLYENMPDVWMKLVSLEQEKNVAFSKWNPITKETLAERHRILSGL